MPVELLLKVRLRIGSVPEGTQWNFEFPVAECAHRERGSGTQPLDNSETALDHALPFLGSKCDFSRQSK